MMVKLVAVLAIFASSFASANNEFRDFFNTVETLSANFNQQTLDESGQVIANTSGYLKFKRPAQFVWQTKQPIDQTLLLNNNELWLIDHELEQASMRNIDELKNTPLYWLLNRPEQLKTLPTFEQESQGIRWYRTQESNQLSFGFAKKQLVAIQLNNQLGQTILVRFKNVNSNSAMSQNIFKLNLSEDFDVIKSF
ncbi:MAG: outer membrane lipoprotein chaperone LolA [Candidatus Thioglobus sp.]|uniref:outer membrane lipoprotein chaperone LolA n=1 Tax=Candidatus Thioglobus sp. TaxID=2026721 RepID=UPI00262E17A2|nr:outer membrane lipoprotein chaperone LolA [Candidatus Thioglobus sp.]MDC9726969.1 outer membrane lipoprotein chaperone LolA [Candidatus Thioglobus sp.]